jgi:hypothetical protein
MARDAQLSGDRVQTEYYLQFADHYFRVLSESRARFEDQNPNQQSRRQRDDDFDDEDGDEEMAEAGEGESSEAEERQDRPNRQERAPRRPREDRQPRRFNREERGSNEDDEQSDQLDRRPHLNGGGDSLPLDVLPPAIGSDDAGAEEEAAPRPKRRTRTPRRPDSDEEVAPAA